MTMNSNVSRRAFLATLTVASASRSSAAISDKELKAKLPVIPKRLEKAFLAPGKMPNGLQAVDDGLWILDQEDPNKVHKVSYKDGSVLKELQTESIHGSGITVGDDGALWIASTFGLTTLKVDPNTGKTLASFDTPGIGEIKWGSRRGRKSGAHGLEWVDGKYWIAVPPPVRIYQIEPTPESSCTASTRPGVRPHGIAWIKAICGAWKATTRHLQDGPKTGELLAKIQLSEDDPEPHGMTMRDGVVWYCDAASRWVCGSCSCSIQIDAVSDHSSGDRRGGFRAVPGVDAADQEHRSVSIWDRQKRPFGSRRSPLHADRGRLHAQLQFALYPSWRSPTEKQHRSSLPQPS